ncbi:MAG: TRAP transporter large permease subunit [Salinisphaera sp.]|jgi:C4-dicarboxylate transporter DctM subunit|nr:TRAP transporter large permease subunit [Salinisphaera sp.]
MLVGKSLTLRKLPELLVDPVLMSGSLPLLVSLANLFAWILTSEQIPQMIAGGILNISDTPWVAILILLVIGTFMETVVALSILFPALLAVVASIGNLRVGQRTHAVVPFLICNISVVGLASCVPSISLWLPTD